MASSGAAAGPVKTGGTSTQLFIRQTSGLVRELGIPAATGISLASVAVVNTFINFNAGLTDFPKADMYLPLVAAAVIWLGRNRAATPPASRTSVMNRLCRATMSARVGGQSVTVPAADWDRLAGEVNRAGFYPVRMDSGGLAALEADPAAVDRLFRSEIAAQMKRWCDLAAERLDPRVRCIITPGNDDPVEADAVLAAHPRVECPEAELCDLGPVAMASLGVVPYTPWDTERETSEEELGKQISAMLDQLPGGRECILNVHCPPYASGLDDAPELDDTLKPVIRGGRPSIVPVGSHAVREAIKRYQPAAGLHGHIHESRGAQKIGRAVRQSRQRLLVGRAARRGGGHRRGRDVPGLPPHDRIGGMPAAAEAEALPARASDVH